MKSLILEDYYPVKLVYSPKSPEPVPADSSRFFYGTMKSAYYLGGSGSDTVSYEKYSPSQGGGLTISLKDNYAVDYNNLNYGKYATDTFSSIENATGSKGNDYIIGSRAKNYLYGGDGDDKLVAIANQFDQFDDVLIGGTGIDTASFSTAIARGIYVNLELGKAWSSYTTITGANSVYQLSELNAAKLSSSCASLTGIENIEGIAAQNDVLIGNNANNIFYASGGADYFDGKGGLDIIDYSNYQHSIYADIWANQWNWGALGVHSANIEGLVGTRFNDELRGNEADNILIGGGGNDTILGISGNDRIYGSGLLSGDDGDDYIQGSGTIYGGANSDTIELTAASTVYGEYGSDYFQSATFNDFVILSIGGGSYVDGEMGKDTISLRAYSAKYATGSVVGVVQFGGETGTIIYQAPSNGGYTQFSDRFAHVENFVGAEAQNMGFKVDVTGYNASTIDLREGTYFVIQGLKAYNGTLSDFKNIAGGAGSDRLFGNDQVNLIEDGAGRDIIEGRGGADIIRLANDGAKDQILYSDISSGGDTIYGFQVGTNGDVINLDSLFDKFDIVLGRATSLAQRSQYVHMDNINGQCHLSANILGQDILLATFADMSSNAYQSLLSDLTKQAQQTILLSA